MSLDLAKEAVVLLKTSQNLHASNFPLVVGALKGEGKKSGFDIAREGGLVGHVELRDLQEVPPTDPAAVVLEHPVAGAPGEGEERAGRGAEDEVEGQRVQLHVEGLAEGRLGGGRVVVQGQDVVVEQEAATAVLLGAAVQAEFLGHKHATLFIQAEGYGVQDNGTLPSGGWGEFCEAPKGLPDNNCMTEQPLHNANTS